MNNRTIILIVGGVLAVLVILALIVAGLIFWLAKPQMVPVDPASEDAPSAEQQVIRTERPQGHTPGNAPLSIPAGDPAPGSPPPRPLLDGLNAPDQTIQDDLDRVQSVFDTYATIFKTHPLGEHDEIIRAFQGDNPRGIALIAEDSPFVDDQDRLRDRWGSPFFFHAISHDRVEILSAGPDQELWTADDVKSRDYPVHPPTTGEEMP